MPNAPKETIFNPAGMNVIARKFLETTKETDPRQKATVVGLSGELGAGKTTFVQAVARALGIAETITSPTFVIEKIYEIPALAKSRFRHLIHIDAYRLESPAELARLGFAEIAADPANLILVEWPERLDDLLPTDTKLLHFSHVNETTRQIS